MAAETEIPVWGGVGPYRADVLATLAGYIHAIAVVDRVAVFLRSGDDPAQMIAVAGVPEDVVGARMPADAGVPGQVLRTGKPLVVANLAELERPLHYTGTEELLAGAGAPIEIDGVTRGALTAYSVEPGRRFSDGDLLLLCETATVGGVALEHAEMRAHVEAQLGATVRAMAAAIDLRDRYTAEHSRDVGTLVRRVGAILELDADVMRDLEYAALLHDIGKIGISDAVLHKPAALDADEWREIQRHPVLGERLLRDVPGLGRVARIVRAEHENFDGSGYPDGLAGEAIPIESRIILACDAYHAMTSDRPYRAAMSHDDAVAEIRAGMGSQFCPDTAAALLEAIGAGNGGREVATPA